MNYIILVFINKLYVRMDQMNTGKHDIFQITYNF